MSSAKRPPITDSPWYWFYLFATAGLLVLVLMGPKYAERQAQLERNYQARQRANQHRVGLEPDTPLSTDDETQIQLWPLYIILFAVLAAAWVGLWWRHFRPARPQTDVERPNAPETSGP